MANQSKTGFVTLVCFVAAVGGFLFGYDLVIISGAEIQLKSYFSLDKTAYGQAVSSAILGCIVGPFLGVFLCDRIGRKKTLILAAVLFGVSAIGTAIPKDITTFNIFRIIGGVGVGLASLASPMYITEIAPRDRRGGLGILYQLAIVIGCTTSVIVAFFLSKYIPDDVNWRWMFASEVVPIAIFVILLMMVPPSPRWLAEKGRNEEALAVMIKVGEPEEAKRELAEIIESMKQETGSFSELFWPGMRMALLVGILLALFNNWTGWSGIAYYLPDLFKMAGAEKVSDALYQTLIINAINIGLTILAIILVDRIGRKPLWVVTAFVMIFSLLFAGFVFHKEIQGNLVLLAIFMCAWPHAIGLGPLPWLMMSEIYPTRIRARAVAITTTFLWIAGYTGARYFPDIASWSTENYGSVVAVFVIYAIICIAALIFGIFMLPETKNKSLEAISRLWLKKKDHQA